MSALEPVAQWQKLEVLPEIMGYNRNTCLTVTLVRFQAGSSNYNTFVRKNSKGGSMKKLITLLFAVEAIIVYGLAIGAYRIADQGGRDFLLLGWLAGIYSTLYLLFEKVK